VPYSVYLCAIVDIAGRHLMNNFYVYQTCIVDLPGGPLEIEWREENNHVYMTGPAEVVFYGSAPL